MCEVSDAVDTEGLYVSPLHGQLDTQAEYSLRAVYETERLTRSCIDRDTAAQAPVFYRY